MSNAMGRSSIFAAGRISICEEGGKTILATLKPTTLLAIFNSPQLEGVAQEVEDTIVKIMKEAASG
jgi:uncharacterized protein (DUF302 family)